MLKNICKNLFFFFQIRSHLQVLGLREDTDISTDHHSGHYIHRHGCRHTYIHVHASGKPLKEADLEGSLQETGGNTMQQRSLGDGRRTVVPNSNSKTGATLQSACRLFAQASPMTLLTLQVSVC